MAAVLALYASGRATVVVLNSGDGVAHAVPVYEGDAKPVGIMQFDLVGQDVTDALMEKLTRRGHPPDSIKREIVRGITEKFAYMALDSGKEIETARDSPAVEKSYESPDGEAITIGTKHFEFAEVLFQPWLVGMHAAGIHETLYNSVEKCDDAIRKDLYGKIVLSVGSMVFPGMANRLSKENTAFAPSGAEIH